MDFFAFLTTWFWYVMAFAAGAVLAWLVARQFIRAESPEEAIEDALDARFDEDDDHDDRRDPDDHDIREEHRRRAPEEDDVNPRTPRAETGSAGRFSSLRRGASSLGGRR